MGKKPSAKEQKKWLRWFLIFAMADLAIMIAIALVPAAQPVLGTLVAIDLAALLVMSLVIVVKLKI